MKRLGCIGLTIMICAGMLAGCGSSLEADTNTVYVSKHGKVVSMDVEQLDQSYYDETELKEFVDSAVDEYNTENGKNSVKVDDLTVEDGTAKLRMVIQRLTVWNCMRVKSCRHWLPGMILTQILRAWIKTAVSRE